MWLSQRANSAFKSTFFISIVASIQESSSEQELYLFRETIERYKSMLFVYFHNKNALHGFSEGKYQHLNYTLGVKTSTLITELNIDVCTNF